MKIIILLRSSSCFHFSSCNYEFVAFALFLRQKSENATIECPSYEESNLWHISTLYPSTLRYTQNFPKCASFFQIGDGKNARNPAIFTKLSQICVSSQMGDAQNTRNPEIFTKFSKVCVVFSDRRLKKYAKSCDFDETFRNLRHIFKEEIAKMREILRFLPQKCQLFNETNPMKH